MAAACEDPEAVYALLVQHILLSFVEPELEDNRQIHDLVRRSLVYAMLAGSGVDTGDEATVRQADLFLGHRIKDTDARAIERRVSGPRATKIAPKGLSLLHRYGKHTFRLRATQ